MDDAHTPFSQLSAVVTSRVDSWKESVGRRLNHVLHELHNRGLPAPLRLAGNLRDAAAQCALSIQDHHRRVVQGAGTMQLTTSGGAQSGFFNDTAGSPSMVGLEPATSNLPSRLR